MVMSWWCYGGVMVVIWSANCSPGRATTPAWHLPPSAPRASRAARRPNPRTRTGSRKSISGFRRTIGIFEYWEVYYPNLSAFLLSLLCKQTPSRLYIFRHCRCTLMHTEMPQIWTQNEMSLYLVETLPPPTWGRFKESSLMICDCVIVMYTFKIWTISLCLLLLPKTSIPRIVDFKYIFFLDQRPNIKIP